VPEQPLRRAGASCDRARSRRDTGA
jgi:hypothetical protein